MKTKTRVALFVVLSALSGLAGCGRSAPPPRPTLAAAPRARAPARPAPLRLTVGKTVAPTTVLSAGDRVQLLVYGEPDLSLERATIRPDGMLTVPLAGAVKATGRTPEQLSRAIDLALRRFVFDVHATVVPLELRSHRVTLMGAVNKPGMYAADGTMRLLTLFALAGGLRKIESDGRLLSGADLQRSLLIRGDKMIAVDFPALVAGRAPHHNVKMKPGDYVYVPTATTHEVYVLGQVRRPRAVRLQPDMTVMKALAAAGGLATDAREAGVKVVRGSLAAPRVIHVPMNDVLSGKAKGIRLRAGDIVYVPTHPLAKWNWVISKLVPGLRQVMVARALSGR